MATIKPFAALRPKPDLAHRICELPYDVMSSEEARAMAEGNPLSFLHVSKPEIDLPPGTDVHSSVVYAKGRENLDRLIKQGALVQDAHPCFYLYRQIMGKHSQTGLVAAASCEDYLDGTIKKHEHTRPDKEDDRCHHIEALNAQTGPVFLTYKAVPSLDELVEARTSGPPVIDYTTSDGVRHSAWILDQAEDIQAIEQTFTDISSLYIADGHHRSAAAVRVFQSRQGAGESARFLAVIFPHDQMQILPYNRVLVDLNELMPERFLDKLKSVFDIRDSTKGLPEKKHEVGLYLAGEWRMLTFRPEVSTTTDPQQALDVALLQKHVLAPVLGIDNPRTSHRISFVGGIRGNAELERMVDSGDYACAFSMFPTGIEDLMAISDAGGIMPPKSTWFEPKLRDAMFCHMLDASPRHIV